MTQQESQRILFTGRIKTGQWEKLKRVNDETFGRVIDEARETGLISSRVYRNQADPDDYLLVSEWRNPEDLQGFVDEYGERFNEEAGVKEEDWEDVIWDLSDAKML